MLAARRRLVVASRGLRTAALAASLALVSGCATISRGLTQDVQVATDPIGAACELRLHDVVVDALPWTPGYVRVRKGLDAYKVACRADGYLDATTPLKAGVESGQVGSATMGALSGLQGTTGSTLTTVALGSVMPAAAAASTAAWLGVAGAVSFLVDLASGAMFEYPAGVALTLVPASFSDREARDAFFGREEKRMREQHAFRRRELIEECRVACTGAIVLMDETLARDIAELERLRASARVGS
jgi:hypothetical protein